MNKIERKIIEVLKCLKEEHGVFEIKAEFEAEGSRIEEMMRLKDITSALDMPIILKTGGVEAVTDMYNALSIGVKGIVAPMAETAFAVSKFTNAIEYKNLKPLLDLGKFNDSFNRIYSTSVKKGENYQKEI